MRPSLVPGRNVDILDIDAGLRMLTQCGYSEPRTVMVVAYALRRWMRGEEAAERMVLNLDHEPWYLGIDLTSWYMVLAASKSA